ncbi:hypothetical protein ACHAXT_013296 [Thalassiosira profunda]
MRFATILALALVGAASTASADRIKLIPALRGKIESAESLD